MPQAHAHSITLEYERYGPADGDPVLLIHGVGAQLVQWPPELIDALVARGYSVLAFDNRDIGLSTHLDNCGVPDLAKAIEVHAAGQEPDLPYRLSDFVADTVGLLDFLGIARVHVFGVSLGGMIAQALAIEHPDRILSQTIMMSHSGSPDAPLPDPAALTRPMPDPRVDEEEFVDASVEVLHVIGSPAYPQEESRLRAFVRDASRRAYNPLGALRQLAAGRCSPDRSIGLAQLDVPTLVVHGTDDPLIPPAGGEDIARKVRQSFMLSISGMGHDLPPQLCDAFAQAFDLNARRSWGRQRG